MLITLIINISRILRLAVNFVNVLISGLKWLHNKTQVHNILLYFTCLSDIRFSLTNAWHRWRHRVASTLIGGYINCCISLLHDTVNFTPAASWSSYTFLLGSDSLAKIRGESKSEQRRLCLTVESSKDVDFICDWYCCSRQKTSWFASQ